MHQAADGALLVQAAPPQPHPTPPSEHTIIQVFGVLIEVVSPSSEEYLNSPMFPVFSSFFSISGQDKVQSSHARIVVCLLCECSCLHFAKFRSPSMGSRSEISCEEFKAVDCLQSAFRLTASHHQLLQLRT